MALGCFPLGRNRKWSCCQTFTLSQVHRALCDNTSFSFPVAIKAPETEEPQQEVDELCGRFPSSEPHFTYLLPRGSCACPHQLSINDHISPKSTYHLQSHSLSPMTELLLIMQATHMGGQIVFSQNMGQHGLCRKGLFEANRCNPKEAKDARSSDRWQAWNRVSRW
ncbi:uncharacterized protein EI97DRAFT_481491 [Westerdykella ornata]|uniref:Uncharacterized protein n=1 Tax=Westerdykella ornata TaxID=318751 RepID=A0A6A6JRJ2_WESOR|nr:uncharacterized protein EI97DRAFT_481491 [Westerdykella ornata]KAF2279241.1 hypothetical protein EI97DRAFT_481491 [Westerdykella ornata]